MSWKAGWILVAAAMIGAPTAQAEEFSVAGSGLVEFDLPSMNLCCAHKPGSAELTCTRVEPKYWIITMQASGDYTVYKDPGEVPGCGYGMPIGNVLDYGESWSMDGFTCSSARSGLTCKANGKGFKLSRKGLKDLN